MCIRDSYDGREQNALPGLNRICSKFEDDRVFGFGSRAPSLQNTEQFPIVFFEFRTVSSSSKNTI